MMVPRLYAIVDVETMRMREFPALQAAEAMLDGGAQMLQWRCKLPVTRAFMREAEKLSELCQRFHAQLIINDRADIAVLLDAGLHVGQADLPVARARQLIGPSAFLGVSTHNEAQLQAAAREPVDYIALGPIFSTPSKRNPDPEVGLQCLHDWRRWTEKPLVAIGGITRKNYLAVFDSGADSVAVISDLLTEELSTDRLRRRMQEWRSLTG
ncbi:MAG: thiamine phosphate synthase [Acidobacteriia bacterium]|nr:thiamine phosphate synthase [Terriglobia bacterium]